MIRKKEGHQYDILRNKTKTKYWKTPIGVVIGIILDFRRYHFEDNFVRKISDFIKPGTIVLVAEVNENNPIVLDNALQCY